MDAQPKRLAVVGGGYIAVEFAGMFQTMGTQVDMYIRGEQILNGFDDEARRVQGLGPSCALAACALSGTQQRPPMRACFGRNTAELALRTSALAVLSLRPAFRCASS